VLQDVIEGRVSAQRAGEDYGVVLTQRPGNGESEVDQNATLRLRAEMQSKRSSAVSMIDRGPGYDLMLRGEAKPRM
jgi:hypothetical protein